MLRTPIVAHCGRLAVAWPACCVAWMVLTLPGCGEDPCTAGQRRCLGEVRQTCVADPGGGRWEADPCPENSTCLQDGRCGMLPLLPCDPSRDQERCDASNLIPGVCTEDGNWLYDVDRACRRPQEMCFTILDRQAVPAVPRALCVLNPPSLCTPGTSSGFCHDDLAATCSPIGYLVLVQDCRAQGTTCRQGGCTP